MRDLHLWAFERGTLWARECGGKGLAPVIPAREAVLREAHSGDTEALASAMGLAGSTEVRRRFDAGRRCFVALVDGAIATYGWVSHGVESIGELERSFRMAPDEAYIWDCATLPPYRGQHLYGALLSHIVTTLCRDGTRRIWIGASLDNSPSIRGFASAGFQPVLTLTYLRLLGIRRVWMAGDTAASPALVTRARECLAV
ncbi:MAG TPA: GNAT family N-acetyltransferase [Ktedonobacterales bacterium]|nr:GNAT family N-acetyltransferase [Ktedonobacterales bacterium]